MNKKDYKESNKWAEEKIKEAYQGKTPVGRASAKSVGKGRRSHETSHEYH
jgi:hypothetical protein